MGKKNKDSSQPSLNSPFKASATSRACAYVGILHALKTGPCSSRCRSFAKYKFLYGLFHFQHEL